MYDCVLRLCLGRSFVWFFGFFFFSFSLCVMKCLTSTFCVLCRSSGRESNEVCSSQVEQDADGVHLPILICFKNVVNKNEMKKSRTEISLCTSESSLFVGFVFSFIFCITNEIGHWTYDKFLKTKEKKTVGRVCMMNDVIKFLVHH